MATVLSSLYLGANRIDIRRPTFSGMKMEMILTHTFLAQVATTDILDLFPIPAYAQLTEFEIINANLGALNLAIGLMTGTPGDTIAARTSGTQLFAAQAAGAQAAVTLANIAALAKIGDLPVSIGVVPSVNITAAANKTLTYRIGYVG